MLIISTLSEQRNIMEYHFAILIIWRSQVQALSGPQCKHLRVSRKCFFHVCVNKALTSFSQVLFSCLRKQCVNKRLESAISDQIILSSFIEYFILSLSYKKPGFLTYSPCSCVTRSVYPQEPLYTFTPIE